MAITLRNQYTASVGAATTAAVVATNGVTTGDLLKIVARTQLPVYMVSVDIGGTLVDAYVRASPAGNRGNEVAAYVLSATVVNGGATITITFSGDHGGARVNIRDFAVSGGTAALDCVTDLSANDLSGDPVNKVTGPTLTLTGTSDVVTQSASANDGGDISVTAVDGLWTDTAFSSAGFADQLGISSFSAPNWSATGATYKSTLALAFGFNPTPSTFVGMVDFSGGTNGVAPTVATMEASTKGMCSITNPIITGTTPRYWVVTNPSTFLTYSTSAHHALLASPPRFAVGGATYSDAGTVGLQLDTSGTGSVRSVLMYVPWSGNAGQGSGPVAMASCYFRTSLSAADTVNMDVLGIYGTESGGSNFSNVILNATGAVLRLQLEGSVDAAVTISADTWYQIAILWERNATGKLMVFSEDGTTQIGTTQTLAQHATAYPYFFYAGDANASAVTVGKTIWWDKLRLFCLGPTQTYPLLDVASGGKPTTYYAQQRVMS